MQIHFQPRGSVEKQPFGYPLTQQGWGMKNGLSETTFKNGRERILCAGATSSGPMKSCADRKPSDQRSMH